MKAALRYTLFGMALAGLLFACIAIYISASDQRHLKTCEVLKVDYADSLRFVSEAQVRKTLEERYGAFLGQRIDSVDLCRIERILDESSAVKKSEAFMTPDGTLHICISQREPRIAFILKDASFYADIQGYLFPVKGELIQGVPTVSGNLPLKCQAGHKGPAASPREQKWVEAMIAMTSYLSYSKAWKGTFKSFTVRDDGNLVFVPAEGSEQFIFGDPFDYSSKLHRVSEYYKKIKPAEPDKTYRSVNVKFEGQIICRTKL